MPWILDNGKLVPCGPSLLPSECPVCGYSSIVSPTDKGIYCTYAVSSDHCNVNGVVWICSKCLAASCEDHARLYIVSKVWIE